MFLLRLSEDVNFGFGIALATVTPLLFTPIGTLIDYPLLQTCGAVLYMGWGFNPSAVYHFAAHAFGANWFAFAAVACLVLFNSRLLHV